MKERIRQKQAPIQVSLGDSIALYENGQLVLKDVIDRSMIITEAVTFDVEKGDFEGAVDGIGGAFLVTKD